MDPVKPLRADGRRNRDAIVDAAVALVRRDGAQVSLEEVARAAGVGSATLHRHFSSRRSLLEAVFRERVTQLCERARAPAGEDPGAELDSWLEALTVYASKNRGLATALLAGPGALTVEEICCTDMVLEVVELLVARAASARALREGVTAMDLLTMSNAIAVATEDDPVSAGRLLRLALTGIHH